MNAKRFPNNSSNQTKKVGDKVILWISGKNSGCYSFAEVTSEPQIISNSKDSHLWKTEDQNPLKAGIKITHNLIDNPILLVVTSMAHLISDKELSLLLNYLPRSNAISRAESKPWKASTGQAFPQNPSGIISSSDI